MIPIQVGARLTVAGVGVTRRGDGKSGGTIRAADLAVTGKPGTLQIRLADPLTNNIREGLGACTGDSGAPVFEMQGGRAVIVGVVSWSTGAEQHRRLRRPHRRHPADAVPRVDFADGERMGCGAVASVARMSQRVARATY